MSLAPTRRFGCLGGGGGGEGVGGAFCFAFSSVAALLFQVNNKVFL